MIVCADLYERGCKERLLVPAAAFVAGLRALNASVTQATWLLARLSQPTPDGPVPFLAFVCPNCVAAAPKPAAPPADLPPLPNIIGNRRPPR